MRGTTRIDFCLWPFLSIRDVRSQDGY